MIDKPPVFVFGSNLAGRHGRGAALHAKQEYGAVYGQAEGYQGNSYAIPTKDANLNVLPINLIAGYVKTFLRFAEANINLNFYVTGIGCGLAGYSPESIVPLFCNVPMNVDLCLEFKSWLERKQEIVAEPAPISHGYSCLCFFCINRAKDGQKQD